MILYRDGMGIDVEIKGMSKKTASGIIFLSTARIVFVNEHYTKADFKSFDIPLGNIQGEKFNQPIFGANNLEVTCTPLYDMIPAPAHIKLRFNKGGCQGFLFGINKALTEVRKQLRARGELDRVYLQSIHNGTFAKTAYVDPSDPTVIYTSQPADTVNNVILFERQ